MSGPSIDLGPAALAAAERRRVFEARDRVAESLGRLEAATRPLLEELDDAGLREDQARTLELVAATLAIAEEIARPLRGGR